MNLKTFVKVGSISNLSDARFCAGFGVDLLGFDLEPGSEHYVSLAEANEIMGWVAGPAFVAELGEMPVGEILELQEENKFPYVQVNQAETADLLHSKGHQVILNVEVSAKEDLAKLSNLTNTHGLAYAIIDCKSPQLIPEIESLLSNLSSVPLIKAYDVELSQLDHIIQVQPFFGIALKGSQEDKPGFKEYDELADILEALEIDD